MKKVKENSTLSMLSLDMRLGGSSVCRKIKRKLDEKVKLKANAKLEKKVKVNWRKELDEMVMVGTGGECVCEERGKVDLGKWRSR